jgi:hypothetical protein
LATPAGQGDDGKADPELAAVLAAGDLGRLPSAFAKARLFVAVEPRMVEADPDTGADKISEMVLVTLRRPDGTTAVPAFTSVAALTTWRSSARPVPVGGSVLAGQACQLGHRMVVLNVGGVDQVSLSVEAVTVPSAAGIAVGRTGT